jgi:hypothetical protein
MSQVAPSVIVKTKVVIVQVCSQNVTPCKFYQWESNLKYSL